MSLVIVEIHGKYIIGDLEQLESEPSIVIHNAYEIIKDSALTKPSFQKYPVYAHENILVVSSVHITTLYPPNKAIETAYNKVALNKTTKKLAEPELLLENTVN